MILSTRLVITLTAGFTLPVAQCFLIGPIQAPGGELVAGAKVSVPYNRQPPGDPPDIVFVWLPMPKGDPRPTSATLNGTLPVPSGEIEVECPDPGKWKLAAFESPFNPSEGRGKLLAIREEEIEVIEPSGSNASTSSVTTTSTDTHASVHNSSPGPDTRTPTSSSASSFVAGAQSATSILVPVTSSSSIPRR
ncbi:hypothetical protein PQX77_002676 [Marasmius sp. AFHP31]|nr:hypothetical protein PQX77_002676 [Marasmius sp. AFHP31]